MPHGNLFKKKFNLLIKRKEKNVFTNLIPEGQK